MKCKVEMTGEKLIYEFEGSSKEYIHFTRTVTWHVPAKGNP
jgi:hypothetical protein